MKWWLNLGIKYLAHRAEEVGCADADVDDDDTDDEFCDNDKDDKDNDDNYKDNYEKDNDMKKQVVESKWRHKVSEGAVGGWVYCQVSSFSSNFGMSSKTGSLKSSH